MTKTLISPGDRDVLKALTGTALAVAEARIRVQERVPASWRLSPGLAYFYDPAGMTQAEIDADDSGALNLAATGHLDADRIFSAIVWTILDTYSAPATVAKYNTAKTKIIAAFKAQPWKA